jgi:hypothetical protein
MIMLRISFGWLLCAIPLSGIGGQTCPPPEKYVTALEAISIAQQELDKNAKQRSKGWRFDARMVSQVTAIKQEEQCEWEIIFLYSLTIPGHVGVRLRLDGKLISFVRGM